MNYHDDVDYDVKSGTIRFPGIDMGGGGMQRLPVVADEKDPTGERVIVVYVPGHTYWNGMSMPRAYAPAKFMVFRLKPIKKKLAAMLLIQFPTSYRLPKPARTPA